MEVLISARVSNRHIHLNKETYELLFDSELTKKNDLNQVGEFASNEFVTIKNGDKEIEGIRVVGPLRPYNQIEVSLTDARKLGLIPPVKRSGDVEDSLNITLKTNKGEVETNGLVLAKRHVHMNSSDAEKYGVSDKQVVKIKIDGERSGVIDAEVKVSDNGFMELHLDTDEANAFLIKDNDKVTMII